MVVGGLALLAVGVQACSSSIDGHGAASSLSVAPHASAAGSPAPVPTGPAPRDPSPQSSAPDLAECGEHVLPEVLDLVVAGVRRKTVLEVPSTYTGHRRLPLLVALHGYGQSAAAFADQARLATAGRALGAIVAVPQGLGHPPGWDVGQVGVNDVAFVAAVVDWFVDHGCADASDVVLAGFSDGADMAVVAGCQGSMPLAGLILVAASTAPEPTCRPLPVVQVHGSDDPIVPLSGRGPDSRPGFSHVPGVGAVDAATRWAALDQCASLGPPSTRGDVQERVGVDCRTAPVILLTLLGAGHTWPGSPTHPPWGAATSSLDTADLVRLVSAGPRAPATSPRP